MLSIYPLTDNPIQIYIYRKYPGFYAPPPPTPLSPTLIKSKTVWQLANWRQKKIGIREDGALVSLLLLRAHPQGLLNVG